MSSVPLSPGRTDEAMESDASDFPQDIWDGVEALQLELQRRNPELLKTNSGAQTQQDSSTPRASAKDPQPEPTKTEAPALNRGGEGRRTNEADWSSIPDVVLTTVLGMLPVLDRINMSKVCSTWQEAAARPLVWQRFDYVVECPKDSPIKLESRIEELRSAHQQCLQMVETYGDKVVAANMVLYCMESLEVVKKMADKCKNLKYCCLAAIDESRLNMLDIAYMLSDLMSARLDLHGLCLKNLYSRIEGDYSDIPVECLNSSSLLKLSLINSFRGANMSQLVSLVNLTELTISPHHLRHYWLSHLTEASLRTLNIVGDLDLLEGNDTFRYPSEDDWRSLNKTGQLHVNCYNISVGSELLCPGVPVATLAFYDTFLVDVSKLPQMTEFYSVTLSTLVSFTTFEGLSIRQKAEDSTVLEIVQKCPELTTVAVPTELCSSTILLMIQLNPNLTDPLVREDLIKYELNKIPEGLNVSKEMHDFTEKNFSREMFVPAVSRLLKRRWHPLSKKEYNQILHRRYFDW
ncbi:uncharacterized protein LOC143283136 [Babylonia areolata]|uniref:uncharacterized protein LOC143283136 n=1 Tax=Babylonia areolata TaxID=304850 RepID=UPI003FD69C63